MSGKSTSMRWIPSLFFAKGMPRVIVFIISLLMLWQFKFSALQIMLCVSLFYLPWALKKWWGAVVDHWLTHRQWILLNQLLLVFLFAGMAQGLGQMTIVIPGLWLIAWVTALHNAAVDNYARQHEQSFRHAIVGELSRKFSLAIGQGILVVLVGNLQVFFRYDRLYSWRVMYYIVAGLFLLLFFWHFQVLKAPERKHSQPTELLPTQGMRGLLLFFLLCYPLAQQMIAKSSILFLIDLKNNGGLGLSPQEFGFVMGTMGITGLTIGALWGRLLLKRRMATNGLSAIFDYQWYMAMSMFVPAIVYILLSIFQPTNLLVSSVSVMIEQFAFGFGFALYLAFIKRLPHREKAKSLMAVSMILSCLLTGILLGVFHYHVFFIITLFLCILSPLSIWALRKG